MKTVAKNRLERLITIKWAVITGLVFLMNAQIATAQNKWRPEIRVGADFATKNLGDTKLKTGFGFEGTLTYHFFPQLGIYGGWTWNKFAADKADLDFNETGYCFGIQLMRSIGTSKMNYTMKGGGTYNHIETENKGGTVLHDTGHGWGWQLGAGLTISLAERWLLLPEIRYRSLSQDITIGTQSTKSNLNYISAGVGLSYSF